MPPEPTNATIESLLAQSGWLESLARQLVADPHEADEIVQETWIAALKHPPQLSVPKRAWLARVARNFALQRGRSETARRQRERSVSREEASSGDTEALDRARTHRRLVDAVLELDEPYRSTVVLHYFDRLPIADVAARQRVPESTVRTRLSRAIGTLRTRFQGEDGAQWSTAFMAFAWKSPATTSTVLASGTLMGGLVMSTGWKIGAATAVVVLGWVLWPSQAPETVHGLDAGAVRSETGESLSTDGPGTVDKRIALGTHAPALGTNADVASLATQSGQASLDVHVRWADDGTPARDIVVSLWRHTGKALDPVADVRDGRTDASGSVHFRDLSAGKVDVLWEGGEADVELLAGLTTSRDVSIPDGTDIDGQVTDEHGQPAADALIWISDSFSGHTAGRSDAGGHYYLRDVALGTSRSIAAVRDGSGPSVEHRIERLERQPAGKKVEIDLVLTAARPALRGFVRDPSGRPVAGAYVEMRNWRRTTADTSGHDVPTYSPPIHRITDSSGAFEARDLGAGGISMTVRAPHYAHWHESIWDDAQLPLDVRLIPEAVVYGIVRDAGGAPIGDIRVEHGEYADATYSMAWTRADGSYRLERLPAGSTEIHVIGGPRGEERRTFDLVQGAEVEWNVTLHPNASVSGRVIDAEGKPLEKWLVAAVELEHLGYWIRSARTDAEGNFTLGNWPANADAVEVDEPVKGSGAPAVVVRDVKPGGKPLEIRVPPEGRVSAFIVGRLLDTEARPLPASQIICSSMLTHRGQLERTDADGRFRIGPLRPGSYAVYVRIEGQAPKVVPDLVLARDQVLDLGDVRLDRPGSLLVRLHFPAGADRKKFMPRLSLNPVGSMEQLTLTVKGDEGRLEALLPGEYDLRFSDDELRAPRTRVMIVADQTTEIDMNLEPCTWRSVQLFLPEGSTLEGPVHLRVRGPSGEDVCDDTFPELPAVSIFLGGLGLGTYQIEASMDAGPAVRATMSVESLTPTMETLELRLH